MAWLVDARGRRLELRTDGTTRIGWASDNDLVLKDSTVSRHHAEISFDNGRAFLRDVGSSNGTFVEGSRVKGVRLSDGSRIRLGQAALTFRTGSLPAVEQVVVKRCGECGVLIAPHSDHCSSCGAPTAVAVRDSTALQSGPPVDYELALLVIPIVACFLAWFWVGNMSLLQRPQSSLGLLVVLTVISTAVIAAAEASKISSGTESQLEVFMGILLLWFVGYPMYLRKRSIYGLKDRSVLGIFVVVLFIGTVVALDWSIESAMSDVQQNLRDLQEKLRQLGG